MLNVSGHLLSTAEVESALMEHRAVVEAAVVSFPHDIKGQALFCYVILKEEFNYTDSIEQELRYIGELSFAFTSFDHLATIGRTTTN